jgi:phosphoribosylamine--glycine ligase
MKYFFISKYGDSAGILPRIQAEGHEVAMYIQEKICKRVLDGIIPKMEIQAGVDWADYVVIDYKGFGVLADKLRRQGKKVWGGCELADRLEMDRGFAFELCKNLGIRVPETYEFTIQEAIEFLRQARKKYIMKSDLDYSTLSFIPESNEYLIQFIQTCPLLTNKRIYLQEYIEGAEISTNIFYTHGKVVPNPDATIETKKFMNNDFGAMTGAMTSLVWVYPEKEPRLYQKTLKKLEYLLTKAEFNVCIDANTIVNDEDVWFLEFTPRLGYNWLYAYIQLLDCEISEFFARLCEGTLTRIPARNGFATAVRVSIPPFPFEMKQQDEKILEKYYTSIPVLIKNFENVYMLDVCLEKNGMFCCGNVVFEASGYHPTDFVEAFRQAYKNTRNIEVANKQIRTDAIPNARNRLEYLKKLNYLSVPVGSSYF